MPRTARIQLPDAFYHVYHRGNRRELIFHDDLDYSQFERMLFEAVAAARVRLYRWNQMPNHFHLLVQTPEANLAEFMQPFLTRYALYFNWRHKLVGHVFQGRYGARVCDKEAYFLELIRYIELNRYRSKSRRGVQPGAWKWSSHRYFMRPADEWPPLLRSTFQEQLDRFSKNPDQARQAYAKFLADGLAEGTWEDFYDAKKGRFLGDETFVQEMKVQLQEPVRGTARRSCRKLTMADLRDEVCRLGRCTPEQLASSSQGRKCGRWRQALVYVGRTYYRFPMKGLTRLLRRDISAGSQIMRRLGEEGNGHSEIEQLLNSVSL